MITNGVEWEWFISTDGPSSEEILIRQALESIKRVLTDSEARQKVDPEAAWRVSELSQASHLISVALSVMEGKRRGRA